MQLATVAPRAVHRAHHLALAPRVDLPLDLGRVLAMAVLHDAGVNGVAGTGMIAKGGCMNCSDEEVIAAVDYMVEGSQ